MSAIRSWLRHSEEHVRDPVELASMIHSFDKVLAGDIRAMLEEALASYGPVEERGYSEDETPRLRRMTALFEWLDRELGPDTEHVHSD